MGGEVLGALVERRLRAAGRGGLGGRGRRDGGRRRRGRCGGRLRGPGRGRRCGRGLRGRLRGRLRLAGRRLRLAGLGRCGLRRRRGLLGGWALRGRRLLPGRGLRARRGPRVQAQLRHLLRGRARSGILRHRAPRRREERRQSEDGQGGAMASQGQAHAPRGLPASGAGCASRSMVMPACPPRNP
ncbi:MAG: hypothetical protein COT56_10805 [Methylobacterium sp. CG09_land_8_20_14_0_10_71_15]|nr:MAG: hypothetical protein COT56_10805 [Methylobacterium sp. CG09_land_8_20_14_0_10_71_15]